MTHAFFTQQLGSDRYPYETIEQVNDTTFIVRGMEFRYDCSSDGRCFDYRSMPEWPLIKIRQRKDGRFYEAGKKYSWYNPTSAPSAYRDLSF